MTLLDARIPRPILAQRSSGPRHTSDPDFTSSSHTQSASEFVSPSVISSFASDEADDDPVGSLTILSMHAGAEISVDPVPTPAALVKKSPSTGNGVHRRRDRGPLQAPILGPLAIRSPTGEEDAARRSCPAVTFRAGEEDVDLPPDLQNNKLTSGAPPAALRSQDLDFGEG
jgi:hypothetical protein